MEAPIVLCGLGRMGTRILEYLHAANLPVVVIDNRCRPDDPRLKGTRLVHGDCRQRCVLEAAGVASARGVLILTNDDLLNISTTLMVRALNPDIRVVLRMFNQNLLVRLGSVLHNVYALSTSLLTAPVLAMTAVAGQALATFQLNGTSDGERQVVEWQVGPSSRMLGRTIGAVMRYREAVPLAYLPHDGADRFLLDIELDTPLRAGDRLVLCGPPRPLTALLDETDAEDAPHLLRWAAWHRRMACVLRRSLAEIDPAVLICTGILFAVILASTLILCLGVEKYKVIDALFRTVSIMATGASMYEQDVEYSPGMKVFVATLRILGAALTAAFTAIVTNYLLRARLGGALEVRRIPDGGHVIVCGLGAIGFRAVEELLRHGERVVVIERDAGNRFVRTVRRLGVPVLVGDAAVRGVLQEAHAVTSRAVIATTDDDLTNLAIALLVRELHADHRVVPVLGDPELARLLREAADVRYALSVPMLAAPAFVASLFGDRVLSVFQVCGRLFTVIDLLIQVGDPFVEHSVRALSVDYHLQAVALLPAEGPPPHLLLAARLRGGDRLVGIIALPDLERLLHRQQPPAVFAVEVLGFPPPSRDWLAGLLRTRRHCTEEEAVRALEQLPLRFAENLTRGQAEDLLAQLARERIDAKLFAPSTEPSTL
ncbi:MAG TPA: NAD-binding protein [Gemmataceae bacterium]